MPRIVIYRCAECGAQHTDPNGWLIAYQDLGGGFFVDLVPPPEPEDYYGEYYCGSPCVIKAMSRWIDSRVKSKVTQ